MSRSLAFAICLPLYACSAPADELYVLKANVPANHGSTIATNIRIEAPEVAAGLDTANIAVLESANHLTYYTGAAWAQPLPQVLQGFFVDAFQQSHAFKNVTSDQEGITANMILFTDIRDYTVDNSASSPSVHIRLIAKLVNAKHQNIRTFTIEKTEASSANHMANIVSAFNTASNEAAAELIQDVKNTYTK